VTKVKKPGRKRRAILCGFTQIICTDSRLAREKFRARMQTTQTPFLCYGSQYFIEKVAVILIGCNESI
jgi:hypothetical protein